MSRRRPHTRKEQLHAAGYSERAARNNPHEGGPEFEARLDGYQRIRDTWGGHASRLGEQLALRGEAIPPSELFAMMGIDQADIHTPGIALSSSGELSDYIYDRRTAYRREANALWRPIEEQYRNECMAAIGALSTPREAQCELADQYFDTADEIEADEAYQRNTELLQEASSAALIASDNLLAARCFEPKDSPEVIKRQAERDATHLRYEQADALVTERRQCIERLRANATAIIQGDSACKFDEFGQYLITTLAQIEASSDATKYAVWRRAVRIFFDEVEEYMSDAFDSCTPDQVWLSEDDLNRFVWRLTTRDEVDAYVEAKITRLKLGFFTALPVQLLPKKQSTTAEQP